MQFTFSNIINTAMMLVISIISYFLREAHMEQKNMKASIIDLRLELLQTKDKVKENHLANIVALENNSNLTNIHMTQFSKTMSSMTEAIDKMKEAIIHMDKNQALVGQTIQNFMTLEDRVLKLEQNK